MEKVKYILIGFEILLSVWILYRSGRIIVNKGSTDDEPWYMLMFVTCIFFMVSMWRLTFSSYILMYSSAIYLLIDLLCMTNFRPVVKALTAIWWVICMIVGTFYG